MKKKIEFDLILGYLLFLFGLISASYGIMSVIINLAFGNLGVYFHAKDVLFDLIFILLGFVLIRKKRTRNFQDHQIG